MREADLAPFSRMDIITVLLVGILAGAIASMKLRGGTGLRGDVLLGMLGAFLGGAVLQTLGWHHPLAVVAAAFAGATFVLLGLRILAGSLGTRRRHT
jgi:uncharacterized membrane protein YeaQ/YmgE (transglycosylase-associated protein family)